jgi:transposase
VRCSGVTVCTSGNVDGYVARVERQAMPEEQRLEISPLLTLIRTTNAEIEAADQRIATIAANDPVIRRLRTVPGVGPITATAFVATLDTWERFEGPHQVEAYLGLVPSEKSSGERQHRGGISKAGNSRSRWLLVEAAWAILRSRRDDTEPLRRWAQRVALLRRFPEGDARAQVSVNGGSWPRWTRRGDGIYYVMHDSLLLAPSEPARAPRSDSRVRCSRPPIPGSS